MSKSKYGNSSLHMTTEEFANMVIDALDEQNYFKKGEPAHPQDIAYAFSTIGETIGIAMSWAIKQEHNLKMKNAVMTGGDLKKGLIDDSTPSTDSYSEWKFKKDI